MKDQAWMFDPSAMNRTYPPGFVWSPPPHDRDIYREMRDSRDPLINPDIAVLRPMEPRKRLTVEELSGTRGRDIYAAIRLMPPDASVTKPQRPASSTGGSTVSGFICP